MAKGKMWSLMWCLLAGCMQTDGRLLHQVPPVFHTEALPPPFPVGWFGEHLGKMWVLVGKSWENKGGGADNLVLSIFILTDLMVPVILVSFFYLAWRFKKICPADSALVDTKKGSLLGPRTLPFRLQMKIYAVKTPNPSSHPAAGVLKSKWSTGKWNEKWLRLWVKR